MNCRNDKAPLRIPPSFKLKQISSIMPVDCCPSSSSQSRRSRNGGSELAMLVLLGTAQQCSPLVACLLACLLPLFGWCLRGFRLFLLRRINSPKILMVCRHDSTPSFESHDVSCVSSLSSCIIVTPCGYWLVCVATRSRAGSNTTVVEE